MVIFRRLLGEVLRAQRMRQGRTLREVSADARVSLGYISEIERGQKEASSELLASICAALDVPLSEVLSEVSDAVALEEAALAMQLEDVTIDTAGLGGPDAGSGPRAGDVVASAA
jgi:transcriptional regulator with XRE-family HTH domain